MLDAVQTVLSPLTLPVVIGATSTLFAAFFGSLAAFCLENGRRKRSEKRDNRAAGNEALLALGFYWNEIVLFRKQHIDRFRDSPGKHILMPPVLMQIEQSYRINFHNLQFIIDDGDVNLISQLSVSERLFHSTVELIRHRSELHIKEVQPKLDAAGIPPASG